MAIEEMSTIERGQSTAHGLTSFSTNHSGSDFSQNFWQIRSVKSMDLKARQLFSTNSLFVIVPFIFHEFLVWGCSVMKERWLLVFETCAFLICKIWRWISIKVDFIT